MSAPLSPGFMILQGNLLEDLRQLAVQWLSDNPLGPLEDECILVQSNGIAQWLKIALASDGEGTGIAAAVNAQLPGRFIWQAYRSVFDELPTRSPFDKTPLTWRLYRLLSNWQQLDIRLGTQIDALEPLKGFLTADDDPRRCYQLSTRLADLYDQYQLYRADWLEAWEQRQDILILANGKQQPLAPEQQWQAIIWRQLGEAIQQEEKTGEWSQSSRAQIHQRFMQECKKYSMTNRPPALPRRVVVFSISSLPRQTLELLQAISPFTQVMIFANNPSQHYWGDLVEGKELLRREYRRIAERKTPANLQPEDLHSYGHPLLASWGKQGRDYLHLLDEHDQPEQYRQLFNHQRIDLFDEPAGHGLLQQLQSDILNLRSLEESRELHAPIDPSRDNSLQFFVAHSPQRELEILHDQLLDSFAAAKASGQPLNPRDILVMVPDINLYAPHIHAVFGRHSSSGDEPRDPRHLPFHISDQSQRRQNTLLIALEKLLQLPSSRFAVSELSDLLDTPAVRKRFAIEESELPSLRRWIEGANIRWGLSANQRNTLELPGIEQNTWQFGLERMLLGFATGANASWQGIQAYDEVAGLEAALLGPLTQLINRLQHNLQQLSAAQNPDSWLETLRQLIADFFAEDSLADTWALDRLGAQLEHLQDTWQDAGIQQDELPLEIVRQELLAGLDETSLTQKFLGGSINFATLMPMRAIPFQQLWLLGMNDKDYPRSTHPADFDLMATDYRPGDRSRREDDRYLFLEAVLSARQRLVISWVGRDIRDNSEKPPSVLVSQLRDHIQAGWTLAEANQSNDKTALLQALTCVHPLQTFSRRYFEVERDPRLFTYNWEWRPLHEQEPQTEAQNSNNSLPHWRPQAAISLADLDSFLRNPVPYFYRQRLGITWLDERTETSDTEPFSPNQLEAWFLRQQLISSLCKQLNSQPHADTEQLLEQELERLQRSGTLPVPPFSQLLRHELQQALSAPLQTYQQRLNQYSQTLPPVPLSVELEQRLQLQDSLANIRHNGNHQYLRVIIQPSVLYSGNSKKYHHLIRQWPAHLLAQLQQPVTTLLLGPNSEISLPSLPRDTARQHLLQLMAGYWQGMQQPLPLACKTSFAALEQSGKPQQVYEGDYNRSGEIQDNPGLQRHWPDYASLSAEADFLVYAEQLYRPLISILEKEEKPED